jgi:multidrug resistance efflux pump
MSSVATAVAVFKGVNLAFEMISAGTLILNRITELQQKRAAEGREITNADLDQLMAEGDVKAAAERVQLAAAKLAQSQSGAKT